MTHARSAQTPRPISSGHALLRRRCSLTGSWLGARCAWPTLPLWRKGLAATQSTHSRQPSWLHRAPPTATSRACLCRCAFRLAIARWSRRFHQSPVRRGVSKRSKHPALALVRELLVTSPNPDGSRAPLSAWTSPCVASPCANLSRRRTFRPALAPFRRRLRSVTRLAVGHPTSQVMTKPMSIHIQLFISSFLSFRSSV